MLPNKYIAQEFILRKAKVIIHILKCFHLYGSSVLLAGWLGFGEFSTQYCDNA